jgi:hypothetical protein
MFRVTSKHHTTGRNKITDHQSMNSFLDDVEQESEDPLLAENEMYKAIGETTYDASHEYQYQNNQKGLKMNKKK